MDLNDLRSLFTVLALLLFAGIVGWAYSAKRKASFDAAAKLALDDDLPAGRGDDAGQPHN